MSGQIIKPLVITSADILSSNVPIDDYPVWTAVAHDKNDRRIYNDVIYECFIDGTTATPTDGLIADPQSWGIVGKPNRLRMWDISRGVGIKTEHPDVIEMSIAPPSPISAIAFAGLEAGRVTVDYYNADEELVFSKEYLTASIGHMTNWWRYFRMPPERDNRTTVFGLPLVVGGRIDIAIRNAGVLAKCGKAVMGTSLAMGKKVRYGQQTRLVPTGKLVRNPITDALEYRGGDVFREVEYTLLVPSKQLDWLERQFKEICKGPAMFVGSERWKNSIIFGAVRGTPTGKLVDPHYSEFKYVVEEME